MPIQSLTELVDSPEVIAGAVGSKMESARSSRAKKRQLAMSQKTLQESFLIPTEGEGTLDCMFCNETFKNREELGKHVLTRHKATLQEPTVLCVEAEYLSPEDKRRKIANASTNQDKKDDDEVFNCEACGETFIDLANLEAHMKKHKEFFLFSCRICGRRFKEPWFLKNHQRTHSSRTGGKNKLAVPETPATINEVVQEQVAKNVTSSYKICKVCGFHFIDKESMLKHIKVHCKGSSVKSDSDSAIRKEQAVPKEEFMGFLNLKPKCKEPESSNKSIKELDPFNTYQAWQLATKGKVALAFGCVKEPSAVVNMETDSDKDEITDLCNTGKMSQSVPLENMDAAKTEDCAKAAPSQDVDEPETPKREEEVKIKSEPDKTPLCTDCGKAFRTYQQMVVHSRIHRKDRSDSESSSMSHIEGLVSTSSSPDTPPASVEAQEAVKMEEMSESESVRGDSPTNVETIGTRRTMPTTKSLIASRKCRYCLKSFRSNYYLNIHLRTHTGEKPYKCEFCDYAAAQKTSLRYHFERHHKLKPGESNALVKIISKRLQLCNKSPDPPQAMVQKRKKIKKHNTATKEDTLSTKPPRRLSALRNTLVNTQQLLFFKSEQAVAIKEPEDEYPKTPSSMDDISLACEESFDLGMFSNEETEESPLFAQEEEQTVPLDLSLKSRQDISASLPDCALFPVYTCLSCPYRTLYPELVVLHQRLEHKQNYDLPQKNVSRSKNPGLILKMRRTGCPLALKGVDVSPMSLNGAWMKTSEQTTTKILNHQKPKRAPAQSSKVTKTEADCKHVGQENELQSGQQVGSFRYLQPDLQGMSHLLERMQQPDQKLALWKPNPQTSSENMPGSEHPAPMMQSLFGENPFTRSQGDLQAFTRRIAQVMANSASSSNYTYPDIFRRLHPSLGNMHNLGRSSFKSAPSVLTNNVPYPCEMTDPRWNQSKPYEQPLTGAPLTAGNPQAGNLPVNQGSDSSAEVKQTVRRRLSKRGFGPIEKIP